MPTYTPGAFTGTPPSANPLSGLFPVSPYGPTYPSPVNFQPPPMNLSQFPNANPMGNRYGPNNFPRFPNANPMGPKYAPTYTPPAPAPLQLGAAPPQPNTGFGRSGGFSSPNAGRPGPPQLGAGPAGPKGPIPTATRGRTSNLGGFTQKAGQRFPNATRVATGKWGRVGARLGAPIAGSIAGNYLRGNADPDAAVLSKDYAQSVLGTAAEGAGYGYSVAGPVGAVVGGLGTGISHAVTGESVFDVLLGGDDGGGINKEQHDVFQQELLATGLDQDGRNEIISQMNEVGKIQGWDNAEEIFSDALLDAQDVVAENDSYAREMRVQAATNKIFESLTGTNTARAQEAYDRSMATVGDMPASMRAGFIDRTERKLDLVHQQNAAYGAQAFIQPPFQSKVAEMQNLAAIDKRVDDAVLYANASEASNLEGGDVQSLAIPEEV